MRNLLYKEFKLSIHKFFLILPIFISALLLIPQWVFLLVFMYFFWISVPNIYSTYNSQNDRMFCMLMPIKKEDYVKTKIISLALLELLHILTAAIFAIIHNLLYTNSNFTLDLNFAFFGVGFIIYAIFNLIFYPIYFKTGYYFGKATIFANIGVILFALIVEMMIIFIPSVRNLMEGISNSQVFWQYVIFFLGILIFIGFNYTAYEISKRKFERIDL